MSTVNKHTIMGDSTRNVHLPLQGLTQKTTYKNYITFYVEFYVNARGLTKNMGTIRKK